MPFKCQIFQTRLTFNNNVVFAKNCDFRLIIILCVLSAILPPVIKCAKLENPQIRLLINDDDLLQEKTNIHEASSAADAAALQHDNSGEHFNLYRSELKRLSYETIHRILRDENEPSYRREETELRYYQKRSPSYEENHQLIKRSAKGKPLELDLSRQNLSQFFSTPQIQQRLNLVSLLDLSYNFLNNLNISLLNNITSLGTLNLQNNSFTSIPLSQHTTLRTLNLNNNLIKSSKISSNIYLRNLYLSGNLIENLSSIQLSLLKNLESLDISRNRLKNLESSFFMQRMHNLKHLNLAFNQLGSIYRETFYNLLSLNTLLLSHNNISDIDYETFLALPNLQFLDLSFNSLQGKSIRALQGITGLVALNIAFNPDIGAYMQEFVASWSLKELDASGTGLCQIPAALAQSVRSLKLTHNWLKVINCGDLDSYPLLQYLDLSFSHIEHIDDDALGRLEILEILMLDHNNLHKVPFSLPVSLEHLFLQNNEIQDIPQMAFQGLINLRTLDLSHNKLMYLPDIMLPKLQTLNLQSSDIRGISQGIIHTLPKLNDLMLEDNPIKCADLLGIAEWASTCRLRTEKEGESEQLAAEEEEGDGEEENFVLRVQELKNKFEQMHNFYEQFGSNVTLVNDTLLSYFGAPACVKDNSNNLQQIDMSTSQDKEADRNLKSNYDLTGTIKEINFNSNSMTSAATANAANDLVEADADVNTEDAVREVQQENHKEMQDENAVKTFNKENPTQSLTAMQPIRFSEKQKKSLTTLKSFDSNASTNGNNATTIATNNNASNRNSSDVDKVVQFKISNDRKIFDELSANANGDAVAVATSNHQQEETALIGNTATNKSSNVTEFEERIIQETARLSKALQFPRREGRMLTNFPFSVITKDMVEGILHKHNKSKDIDVKQFIKSTTIATPINSEKQVTTTATTPLSKFRSTAAALATTLMTEAFTQTLQRSKHDNVKDEEGEEFKEQAGDVVGFERTTSNLQINLEKENQQHNHEIKTKIATTKEIKYLATKNPKSMQTNRYEILAAAAGERKTAATTKTATTTNITMTKRTLKIPSKLTANLDKPNKELNGFIHQPTTSSPTVDLLTTNLFRIKPTTTTSTHKPAIKEKHELVQTTAKTTTSVAAAKFKTFKTIEQQNISTTPTSTTKAALLEDKDLASNYNDNENKRQITKTINKTSNISATTTTPTTTTSSSSNNSSISTSEYNKNNRIAKTLDITAATTTTTAAINNQQQQSSTLFQDLVSNYRQFLQKDVIVKCTQSTSHECQSAAASTATQWPDKFGRTPNIEATLEQTTVSKTSTEIPEAAMAASTTPVIHKHEPLQLLVKDRHLIGTPLLMHKGENLMVTADELILPTNNRNAEQEENNNNNNNKELHGLETNTMANDNKYQNHLEVSQTTKLSETTTTAITTTTEPTANNLTKDEHKINKLTTKNLQQDIKLENPDVRQNDLEKMKKNKDETKTKKPSLIMKKMTIITKQHEETQHVQATEPLENEVHGKQFDNSHYQELKPLTANLEKEISKTHTLKHSTVNTPIQGNLPEDEGNMQPGKLLRQPHTFQHEHELLIQQILQDQQVDTHAKLTKSEQWSDLRKAESKENHPGLILLVSSGLFLVLLVGLMHVYRCDMPWRRHSPSHHMRPHQRQNHSLEDDSHSFLSYSEGIQKWHHSTRLEAPYNSPLHNLHVRELQKTSATEKPATVKSTVINFKAPALSRPIAPESCRSMSQSSTTTTSTASASSSAILDDESFYIEMTPDSGQFAGAVQSELLPMELLNKAQTQSLDYQDTVGDSQISMEDDCVVHYQQHQRHLPHLNDLTTSSSSNSASSSTATAALTCAVSSTLSTPNRSVKPRAQSRKFGLW